MIRREGIDTGVGAKSDVAHVDDYRRRNGNLSHMALRAAMTLEGEKADLGHMALRDAMTLEGEKADLGHIAC